MIANYGYRDGAGYFFISIDTDKCNGCGECVKACPRGVLELALNEVDPLSDALVAVVTEAQRKKIRYTCSPCKPYLTSLAGEQTELSLREMKKLPCVAVCEPEAIAHSW